VRMDEEIQSQSIPKCEKLRTLFQWHSLSLDGLDSDP
jgi:hypothetical protein